MNKLVASLILSLATIAHADLSDAQPQSAEKEGHDVGIEWIRDGKVRPGDTISPELKDRLFIMGAVLAMRQGVSGADAITYRVHFAEAAEVEIVDYKPTDQPLLNDAGE